MDPVLRERYSRQILFPPLGEQGQERLLEAKRPFCEPFGQCLAVAVLHHEEGLARAKAWQAAKADAGWACIRWPREYGGRGLTVTEEMIVQQEMALAKAPPVLNILGVGMAGPTIIAYGTEEQKQRYIRPMLRADEVWCQLFSEPAAGSDLAGLRTSAVRDGDAPLVVNAAEKKVERGLPPLAT